ATIAVVAPRGGRAPSDISTKTIAARPGEKAYEELMTEDESTRARDIGEMFAVLPSIQIRPGVAEAYAATTLAPVGAYRSDSVEPMTAEEVRAMVAEVFEAERDP